MGNRIATAVGDSMTCFRDHENQDAVSRGMAAGTGKDLDDAVLAATSNMLDAHQGLQQTLRLTFACKDLPNMDTFTRTDGMLVLHERRGNFWSQVGMTEVIMDNLDPDWVKCFDVPYKFEEVQTFKACVHDIDDFDNLKNFSRNELVGEVEFTLHEVVTAKDQILEKNITPKKKTALIQIAGEELDQTGDQEQVILQPCLNFSNDNSQRSNILFFILYKTHSTNGRNTVWKPVYKSEIKANDPQSRNETKFIFNQFSVLLSDICGTDQDKEIKIEFFQSSKTGKHRNLGQSLFTANELRQDPEISLSMTKQNKAKVSFLKCKFQQRNSFLNYIFGGCEINLAIGIDFTLSNGDPNTDPSSLHSKRMSQNQYYQALKSVGDILQFYDTDKQFPTFGFGGKLELGGLTQNRASHCFALNGNIFDPECDGLDGILDAYKNALKEVKLYGPTHFNEVLEMTCDMAEGLEVSQRNQKYLILLIITDGIINDMQKTIDQIVRGSSLPLSIIIVGVGDADFSSMDVLDADDEPLYSQRFKKYMASDIVQFVPFSEFKNDARLLAKETLEEIPRQFIDYMERNNIVPKSVHEEERRRIREGLRSQKSMASSVRSVKEQPEFFGQMEEKFIMKMSEMGFDYTELKDLIEDKGVPELNEGLVADILANQNRYKNKLFVKPEQPEIQYDYVEDHSRMMQQDMSIVSQGHGAIGHISQVSQVPGKGRRNLSSVMPMHKSATVSVAPQGGAPVLAPQQHFGDRHFTSMQSQISNTIEDDKDVCKVCLIATINSVVIPCGHRCICMNCSDSLKNKECPICRGKIKQVVQTFDS